MDAFAHVRDLARRVKRTAPALNSTRLVLIDGPAGAGKTTLAAHLASLLSADAQVQTLHADDMYEGWLGLPGLSEVLIDQVIAPLAAGRSGVFRRWDWHASERAERIVVPPQPVLIIEGVGVAMAAARVYASVVAWVEAPPDECLRRGIERDGESMRNEWIRWQQAQALEFARQGTREAADVLISTGVS